MNHARPVLLGYIRADVLNATELPAAKAALEAFADREGFALGTVFVRRADAPAAFHALMEELVRDEASWVVVPDMRHVTVVEELVVTCYENGARLTIFAAASPHAGGPGPDAPDPGRARRSTPLTALSAPSTYP